MILIILALKKISKETILIIKMISKKASTMKTGKHLRKEEDRGL